MDKIVIIDTKPQDLNRYKVPASASIVNLLTIDKITPEDINNTRYNFCITPAALLELLENYKKELALDNYLTLKSKNECYKLHINQVDFFSAEQKYVLVNSANKQMLIDETLNNLEEKYSANFLRIHRKYLVNKKKIYALKKQQEQFVVLLENIEQPLIVSRRQLPQVRKFLKCLS